MGLNERAGMIHGMGCGRAYLHREKTEACICGLDRLADERDALQLKLKELTTQPTDRIELTDGQGGMFTPTRPDALKVVLEYQIPAFKAKIEQLEANRRKAETARAKAEADQAQLSIALRLLVDYEDELWTYVGCPQDLNAFGQRSLSAPKAYDKWRLMVEALEDVAYRNHEGFCMLCGIPHREGSDCVVYKALKVNAPGAE